MWILKVYSKLVFINEGSAEVLVILIQDFYLLNLSKIPGKLGQQIWINFNLLAKFTKCFRQVQQVKVLNKDHEDLCWTLIDTYKLAVYCQYLFLVKYWSHHRKKYWNFLRVILNPGWIQLYVFSPLWCFLVQIFPFWYLYKQGYVLILYSTCGYLFVFLE